MYAGAVNLAAIMLKTIEERLLAAPVEPVSPVGDELSQIHRAHPSVPIVGGAWRQPGGAKAQREISQDRIRYRDLKWF
jgi:hypothetical protein